MEFDPKFVGSALMANGVSNFIASTIRGHERGLFRTASIGNKNGITKETLKDPVAMKSIIYQIGVNYFNIIYDALVKKDDTFVNKTFGEFKLFVDHSPQCVINILARMYIEFHVNLPRDNLNVNNTLDEFDNTVKNAIESIITPKTKTKTLLQEMFMHECTGPKEVEPLLPGQKMFNLEYSNKDDEKTDKTNKTDNTDNTDKNDKHEKCVVCNKTTTKKCGLCKNHYICNVECQRKDWPNHKQYCVKK